ncbi:hypothetical protein GF420_15765 [candidate division GN15 bacterium]|nr:hypothetical protein [candidate division GN15 bacterium]
MNTKLKTFLNELAQQDRLRSGQKTVAIFLKEEVDDDATVEELVPNWRNQYFSLSKKRGHLTEGSLSVYKSAFKGLVRTFIEDTCSGETIETLQEFLNNEEVATEEIGISKSRQNRIKAGLRDLVDLMGELYPLSEVYNILDSVREFQSTIGEIEGSPTYVKKKLAAVRNGIGYYALYLDRVRNEALETAESFTTTPEAVSAEYTTPEPPTFEDEEVGQPSASDDLSEVRDTLDRVLTEPPTIPEDEGEEFSGKAFRREQLQTEGGCVTLIIEGELSPDDAFRLALFALAQSPKVDPRMVGAVTAAHTGLSN